MTVLRFFKLLFEKRKLEKELRLRERMSKFPPEPMKTLYEKYGDHSGRKLLESIMDETKNKDLK